MRARCVCIFEKNSIACMTTISLLCLVFLSIFAASSASFVLPVSHLLPLPFPPFITTLYRLNCTCVAAIATCATLHARIRNGYRAAATSKRGTRKRVNAVNHAFPYLFPLPLPAPLSPTRKAQPNVIANRCAGSD